MRKLLQVAKPKCRPGAAEGFGEQRSTARPEAECGTQASYEAGVDRGAQAQREADAEGGTKVRLEAGRKRRKGYEPWFAEMGAQALGFGNEGTDRREIGQPDAARKRCGRTWRDRAEKSVQQGFRLPVPAGETKRAAGAGNRNSPSG